MLSPLLCNLYTSDAMEGISCSRSEYADDDTIWKSGSNLTELIDIVSEDGDKIAEDWCDKWNMEISSVKTEAMIISPESLDKSKCTIKLKGQSIQIVKKKKILGIIVDDELKFEDHIASRKLKGFKALKGIDFLVKDNHGCSQDIFMKLYRALVIPTMDYGAAAFVTATDLAQREFNQVQRSALLKATGCLSNTSLDTLELLTNCIPTYLHLKLRQAEELIRIYSKNEEEPILKEFIQSLEDHCVRGKKTTFNMLLTAFNELKGRVSLENVAKDFKYTEDCMLLNRQTKGKCMWKELDNEKKIQEENIKVLLENLGNDCVAAFTDGSALGNPGPTGAGAVIYLQGLLDNPVCLKKTICSNGNNYLGEIVGIEMALSFLQDEISITGRNIHLFVDCQSAIISGFGMDVPTYKVDIILNIRRLTSLLEDKENTLHVHWIPGHKDFEGNEKADNLAKEAAKGMVDKKVDFYEGVAEKKEIIQIMRSSIKDKWQRMVDNSKTTDKIHETITQVGTAFVVKNEERRVTRVINQLISGNAYLNYMVSKIDTSKSELCDSCKTRETINHYLYDCERYNRERIELEKDLERILTTHGLQHISDINIKVMTGNLEEASKTANLELRNALTLYISKTKRFFKKN